jgi:hypothetical protein
VSLKPPSETHRLAAGTSCPWLQSPSSQRLKPSRSSAVTDPRLAAHESWARTTDPSARTEPARRALLDRFEREVDPDGVLPPEERARRAAHARKAYFTRLALRSAEARRRKF